MNKTIIIGDDGDEVATTNEDDIGSGSSELPIKIGLLYTFFLNLITQFEKIIINFCYILYINRF